MHRTLDPEDIEQASISFMRDWFIGNAVQHKNVVRILDIFTMEGDLCVAMELVDGLTFEDILRRVGERGVRLPLVVVLEMGLGVCAGLAAIHDARRPDGAPYSIVHRDIKPSNLMVDWEGDVRVLDLGIARGEGLPGSTETGMVKGTVRYMAPEQHRSGPVTQRADLFAVGVVLYELLTGEQLFAQFESDALRKAKLDGRALSRVRELDPATGPLKETLLRCLQPDPQQRHPSARVLAAELDTQLRSLPRSNLKDLMNALRGDVAPSLRRLPDWQQLADALDQPLRPRHSSNLAALRSPVAPPPPAPLRPQAPSPPPAPSTPAATRGPRPVETPTRPATQADPRPQPPREDLPLPPTPETRRLPEEPAPPPQELPSAGPTVVIRRSERQESRPPVSERQEPKPLLTPENRRLIVLVLLSALGAAILGLATVGLLAGPLQDLVDRWQTPAPPAAAPAQNVPAGPEVETAKENPVVCADDPNRAPEPEIPCNGRDDDCDGALAPQEVDVDGDGYLACTRGASDAPIARTEIKGGGDCDDGNPAIFPGAPGRESGVDLNCDGIAGMPEQDSDADGTADSRDCAKNNRAIHPGARETIADGTDSDCDGKERCYQDNDGDGMGGAVVFSTILSCSGHGISATSGDCDDADSNTNVAAREIVGDGKDNDCDALFDEQPPILKPDFSRVRVQIAGTPARQGKRLTLSLEVADPDNTCSTFHMRWNQNLPKEWPSETLPGSGATRSVSVNLEKRDGVYVYFRCCARDQRTCEEVPPYSKANPLHIK